MRTIAILKPLSESENRRLLSASGENDRILYFESEQALLESPELENTEIVFGEPDLGTISRMKKLRWIQMTWAGANKYTSSPELFGNISLTSASGAFGMVISEHIVSGILELYRNLRAYRALMQNGGWERLEGDETLEGKRVLILGTGNIGTETAKKIKCFGAVTVGISRTKKNGIPFFDETYTVDELDAQLATADVIVSALPGTPKTRGLFDARRISLMKKNAVLVNVGRGFTVDTDAAVKALSDKKIRGAVLDVVDPEPLPENHPLRNMENVVLTPHVSGVSWGENLFTRNRILDIFCENLKADSRNEKKKNEINFAEGY